MTHPFTLLAAVLFVAGVYATAEAIHHAGLNPFSPAFDASPPSRPASAQLSTASKASGGNGGGRER